MKKETYKSHYCCWEQDTPADTPACGIPIEKHTQCCLCGKRVQICKNGHIMTGIGDNQCPECEEDFLEEESQSTEQILTEILAEIHTLPKSFAKSFNGGQLREAGYLEAKRDIARIIKSYILNEK